MNRLKDNLLEVSRLHDLIPLNKNIYPHSGIEFSESLTDPTLVKVSYPTFFNKFIRETIKAAKKNKMIKLHDDTAVKNYFMYICAISNYVGNKAFTLPVSYLAKVTYSGAWDVNSNTACVNNLLFITKFFEQCGLMHVELIGDDIRISEVCVPKTTQAHSVQYWSISFKFSTEEEKTKMMNSLSIQAADSKKINVNLTDEQVGYLRCAVSTSISEMDTVLSDEVIDTDAKLVYLGKMIEMYKKEYEKAIIDKVDTDSSLFSRNLLK